MSLIKKTIFLSITCLFLFSFQAQAEQRVGESQELLIARTGAQQAEVRSDAANILKRYANGQTVSRLIDLTEDGDWRVRFDAVKTLGRLAEPTAAAPIQPLIQDPMPHVRMISVWSLYQIGDLNAVPTIIEAVKDQDHQVRAMAQRALKNISESVESRSFEEWSAWWTENEEMVASTWGE